MDHKDWANGWVWLTPFGQFEQGLMCITLLKRKLNFLPSSVCQDPALTTLWGLDRQHRLPWERVLLLALVAYSHFSVSSHFRRTHVPLVLTLPVYSRTAHTHTSGVLTHRSYSHFRRTHEPLVVLTVSVTPSMVSSRSSHTPCVGLLFSRYPSSPAWSRRGPLTRLAWARCSRGIRHGRRGLVAVL